ncbi:hypothetical protein Atai01_41930 [Amycolatopsis taiwanensis]|uniref:Uncharacterized protein n=1 Tax=Amycolatopsis taiwanensis TaxID=342230 RepID=A0A9W6R1R9_9PSEU|nr:hypothetical protein Atai01_41930 [Amycolatopsis taiwanensis]
MGNASDATATSAATTVSCPGNGNRRQPRHAADRGPRSALAQSMPDMVARGQAGHILPETDPRSGRATFRGRNMPEGRCAPLALQDNVAGSGRRAKPARDPVQRRRSRT